MLKSLFQTLLVFCVLFLIFGGMIVAATWLVHHLFGWIFPGVERHWHLLPATVVGIASVVMGIKFVTWMNSDRGPRDWENEDGEDDDDVITVPIDFLYGRRKRKPSPLKKRRRP
jgi:hypothetical protein